MADPAHGRAEMHLRILGTRGEIQESAPGHRRHSGVLVNGRFLLDMGEREYLELHPERVLITHLHPDHAFFITDDFYTDVPLYAPEPYHNQVQVQSLPETMTLEGLTVRSLPTHHSKRAMSVAFVVRGDRHAFCYTGDIIWLNREYHPFLEDLDFVITDGSYIRKGGMVRKDRETGRLYGHTGIPDLIRLFSPFTDRILFVHFGSWFFRDIPNARETIRALGHEYGVEAEATRDDQDIEL